MTPNARKRIAELYPLPNKEYYGNSIAYRNDLFIVEEKIRAASLGYAICRQEDDEYFSKIIEENARLKKELEQAKERISIIDSTY